MTEDQRNGRMRTVGSVAAALVLRLLVEANKGRSVVTPNGVAGAGKTVADTQGGKCAGCAKALDQREPSPNRSGRMAYTAIPAPARVFET